MILPWRNRHDLPRALALAAVATLVWLMATGNWTAAAWQTPASYSVDALETLARFQVAQEQGLALLTQPQVARLGAPVGANWSAYPLPDFPWYWVAGKFSAALGVVPASNLMLLLAHLAAVLAFYGVARALGQRPLFAASAALLFGFCFSIWHRGLSHHSFALAFGVPLAWLVVWLVAGSRRWVRTRRGLVTVAVIGALLGFANPYYVYLFGLLLGAAALIGSARTRHWANARAALVAGGACLATFAVAYAPFLTASATARYARGADNAALYGLRWLDLVAPPPNHHASFLGALGRAYGEQRAGEPYAPYLGLVGALALAALLGTAVVALLRRRRPPALAFWAAGVLAFALSGGLNTALAALGLDQFRASNRYSVHLLVVALVFLAQAAARWTAPWSRARRLLVVAVLTAVGLWDQIPRTPPAEHRAGLAAQAELDRSVGAELERALPAGTAVLQLPVAVFPEQGPILGMSDYEHLRLFLGTTSLRFSYGHLAGNRFLVWQRNVARLPPAQLIAAAERAGFGAIALHRAGLPEQGKDLTAALLGAGRPLVAARGPHAVFALRPLPPTGTPGRDDVLSFERWDGQPTEPQAAAVLIDDGWYGVEHDGDRTWRWAGATASLQLHNDQPLPRRVRLQAEVTAVVPTTLTIRSGTTTHHLALRPYTPERLDLELVVDAGLTRVELSVAAPAQPAGPADPRRIAFNLAQVDAAFAVPGRP
jgi:hypothetical protein